MSIFLVGMLVGGGSIYVVEYSPNSLTVITSINKPDTTPPQRSTTSARAQRMNEQYQRQLAYLRILRQQQPTSANAKKSAKSTPEKRKVDRARVRPGQATEAKASQAPRHSTVDSLAISALRRRPPQTRPVTPSETRANTSPPRQQAAPRQTRRDDRPTHSTHKSAAGEGLYYEVLRAIPEFNSKKVYAEVLVPTLSLEMPRKELKRIVKAIAEHEGFYSMTVYRTRLAREAHYSMELADAHPRALAEGLLGEYERGRFKPYKPK